MAAGLAIDLKSELLHSLEGRFSRDCRNPWQALLPPCSGKRAFVLWVPDPKEPGSAPEGLSSNSRLCLWGDDQGGFFFSSDDAEAPIALQKGVL
jgi:hypothetical protein